MIGYYSVVLFFFSLLFLILFLYSLTKQRNRLAALFACFCLTISVYIGGSALELLAVNAEQVKFALFVEYFGGPFIVAFWLLISYKFVFMKSASLNLTLLIMTIPFITLFLSVTNDHHHLIYTSLSILKYDGYLLAQLARGPLYYASLLFSYAASVFGMAVFFRAWRMKLYQFRTQAFWLFLGAICPTAASMIYNAGLFPLPLDPTSFGLSMTGICFCVAIFRFGFLELHEIVKDVEYLEINEGILVIDDKNRLIEFNQACREIFGWLDLSHIGMDLAAFPEGKKMISHTAQTFEMKITKKGMEKYCEFRKSPLLDQDVKIGSVYFIRDISGQKEMIRQLHDMASYDSLTKLYNRNSLIEELEKEIRRLTRYGCCLSVLMIDIDHFSLVNDQYGFQAGDKVIAALANTCRDRLRKTDLIGRYGGEEFLAVLPEANEENALYIAESIRKSIADLSFLSSGSVIHITVSIGIKTVYSHDTDLTSESILNGAGSALYHAKQNGRNQASAISDTV
ncbi:MAG TPA: diguanylate cyclase [Anaerovoracaceae bacterium]|nr:diguanylate cyclase [Anaerovoracaceae bacterium]